MKFEDALPFIRRGVRYQRAAWHSAPRYGVQTDRVAGHVRLVLGFGLMAGTQPWKTAALDILADDWQECVNPPPQRPHTEVD